MSVRTRFAPSPTGFLHLGNIRSALYPWAFARKNHGVFILRIEDTDTERSTPEATQMILEAMDWLGLNYDEGPYYQMQRMPRYREVLDQLLAQGLVYPCYTTSAELDELREEQMARGEKPRYDRRWRPEPGKILPEVPAGVAPALRFKNPINGVVVWEDKVKGCIEIANEELDDLVVMRADGTPTYNFCVVVDDLDMKITHVIRGDDHVNNTPRQINILRAMGVEPPVYAHLPTVLTPEGDKLSKRHGAKSVMQYAEEGYLPDAVVNYLARLGWSHGDAEVFSREELLTWFDLDNLSASPGRFNPEKLRWLNQEYVKKTSAEELGRLLADQLRSRGLLVTDAPAIAQVADLYRDRAATMAEMAEMTRFFYQPITPDPALVAEHIQEGNRSGLLALVQQLAAIPVWEKAAIHAAIKSVAQEYQLKLPQLMMPLRVLVAGSTSTPGVDGLLAVLGQAESLRRLQF